MLSRCDSTPQPATPCGPKHWNASTIESAPSTLVSPLMLCSQVRGFTSASTSVEVGLIRISASSLPQKSEHANEKSSPLNANSWSAARSTQLDSPSRPPSGVVLGHRGLPESVVVIPMR